MKNPLRDHVSWVTNAECKDSLKIVKWLIDGVSGAGTIPLSMCTMQW